MNVLIASATIPEIAPLMDFLDIKANKPGLFSSENDQWKHVSVLISGMTMVAAATYLSATLARGKVDLVINAGLAGRYHKGIKLAETVVVTEEVLCELGAADGRNFVPINEMEIGSLCPDFEEGCILQHPLPQYKSMLAGMQQVKGVTINTINGNRETIDRIVSLWSPDVESMEGAGFMFAAKVFGVDFIELRCISNNVGPRDKGAWCIDKAVEQLNSKLMGILENIKTLS